MRGDICKLVEPTLDDFRLEFPKPEACTRDYNVNHGWIAPHGEFFTCPYAGHDTWADNLMAYWPEVVDENKNPWIDVVPFSVRNEEFRTKYGQDMSAADYLVSQGWLKWMFRITHHEIVKGNRDLTQFHWQRIGWLNVHSTTESYEIIHVDV